jgi:hypothetical protein
MALGALGLGADKTLLPQRGIAPGAGLGRGLAAFRFARLRPGGSDRRPGTRQRMAAGEQALAQIDRVHFRQQLAGLDHFALLDMHARHPPRAGRPDQDAAPRFDDADAEQRSPQRAARGIDGAHLRHRRQGAGAQQHQAEAERRQPTQQQQRVPAGEAWFHRDCPALPKPSPMRNSRRSLTMSWW